MGDLRQPEAVRVVVLSVVVGVAVGLFATHELEELFWAVVGLLAVWFIPWLWLRLVRAQLDWQRLSRGWRD